MMEGLPAKQARMKNFKGLKLNGFLILERDKYFRCYKSTFRQLSIQYRYLYLISTSLVNDKVCGDIRIQTALNL